MDRYKLARVVDGMYLSANNEAERPWPKATIFADSCLEYKVGEVTTAKGKGVACYAKREDAMRLAHRQEAQGFNHGMPIVLLTLRPIGRTVYADKRYCKGGAYEGGRNYRSVEVLAVTRIA